MRVVWKWHPFVLNWTSQSLWMCVCVCVWGSDDINQHYISVTLVLYECFCSDGSLIDEARLNFKHLLKHAQRINKDWRYAQIYTHTQSLSLSLSQTQKAQVWPVWGAPREKETWSRETANVSLCKTDLVSSESHCQIYQRTIVLSPWRSVSSSPRRRARSDGEEAESLRERSAAGKLRFRAEQRNTWRVNPDGAQNWPCLCSLNTRSVVVCDSLLHTSQESVIRCK